MCAEKRRFKLYWWRYILLALPLSVLLGLVIKYKLTFFFWSYFAIMGISALIAKWYSGEENKNRFIAYSVHTAMVSVFALFMWGGVNYLIKWILSI